MSRPTPTQVGGPGAIPQPGPRAEQPGVVTASRTESISSHDRLLGAGIPGLAALETAGVQYEAAGRLWGAADSDAEGERRAAGGDGFGCERHPRWKATALAIERGSAGGHWRKIVQRCTTSPSGRIGGRKAQPGWVNADEWW